MAAREDLKEGYKMTKSNSSWWCRTAQEGKNPKFPRGRLGLAIRKSFFLQESGAALEGVPREAAKPNSLAQSHGALALGPSRSKPNSGLETPEQPIPPPVPPSCGILGQGNGRHRSSWSDARP